MNRNFYPFFSFVLMLACLSAKDGHAFASPGREASEALEPPYLEPYPFTTFQTNIGIFLGSYEEGGTVELYRSTNSTTGFVLIGTFNESTEFTDYDLKPRTTYYYKGRTVFNGEYSDYNYYSYTTESKWYEPDLTASLNPGGTSITLKLTDHSYQEEGYQILRNGESTPFFVNAPDSGQVFTFVDSDLQSNTTYHYTVNANLKDEGHPYLENVAEATVTTGFVPCAGNGSIEREKWNNIPGWDPASIPTGTTPDVITVLSSFQAPTNDGSNYGVRVRGFICPPASGKYTFWISSDDKSELWLSTDSDPANKIKIAYVSDHTNPLEWTKYASQRSAQIQLSQGQNYYIEAIHKEILGNDNLAVGWQLPNGALERPIPGNRLIKFPRSDYPPKVNITSPSEGQTFTAPATITITADASDPEGPISRVQFYNGTTSLGTDFDPPYSIQWQNVQAGNYKIEARAFDNHNSATSDFVNISVTGPSCAGTGIIQREYWMNIPGTSVSSVPFDTPPQSYNRYSSFETDQYEGTNYGSRMRAFICVPQNGNYIFWISSDDNSELWLSTDENPANKIRIASVSGATKFREYTKYASQQSVAITLQAGRKYYIEALHKEGTGNDFISVGWQLPNGALERPIPGNRLIPIGLIGENKHPVVAITSPADNSTFAAPANILIKADASDPDGSIYKVQFEANSVVLGQDMSAPYEFQWNNVPAGTYRVIARATDNRGVTEAAGINITVGGGNTCDGTGKIYREIWTGIPGTSVSSVPFNTTPNTVVELTSFSTQNYYGNDYGSRIRGYLCVPVSGTFTFYIASDDNSQLWLSTDDTPDNKKMIAYLNGAVSMGDYFKYATQTSAGIPLVGGKRYYIEALHKEGNGGDHVSVAWRFQEGTFEGPIPGNRLIPYNDPAASMASVVRAEPQAEIVTVAVYPNPARSAAELTIGVPDGANSEVKIEMITGSGFVLQREQRVASPSGEVKFPLKESLASGMYFLKIFSNRKQQTVKLMVE